MADGDGPSGDNGIPRPVPSSGQSDKRGGVRVSRTVVAEWQGPLPPPSLLADYDELVKDGAERVFRQFELEAEHRRSMEMSAHIEDRQERIWAQVIAGAFVFCALGVAVYALFVGAFAVAGIIGGATIASVVGAFLLRRGQRPPEEDLS